MNAVQAMRLATGAVIGTCAGAGLTLHTIRARDGKIAFLGAGKGEKDEMMDAAKRRWPTTPWPNAKCRMEHATDAVAAYLAWKRRSE